MLVDKDDEFTRMVIINAKLKLFLTNNTEITPSQMADLTSASNSNTLSEVNL